MIKYFKHIELECILIMFIMIMIYYFALLFINFLKITLNLCLFILFEKKVSGLILKNYIRFNF